MFEMEKWLEVRKELYGASWYRSELSELYSYPYAARGKHAGVRSLLKVSASRAGVLCPTCHSKNDDGYHFCQWCGNTVSAHYRQVDGKGPLKIDEDAISRRYRQFTAARAEKSVHQE